MNFDGWMAEQESGRRREVRTVMGEGNEVVRRTLGPILPVFFFSVMKTNQSPTGVERSLSRLGSLPLQEARRPNTRL
jgi:hypothetical protein